MEEASGVETSLPLRGLLAILRCFRPPTYERMPYIERLKADFFIFAMVPINVALFFITVCFHLGFMAVDVELPGRLTLLSCLLCGGTAMASLGFVSAYTSGRMGTAASRLGLIGSVTFPIVIVGLMVDRAQLVLFPMHFIPLFLVHLTNISIGAASAALPFVYYVFWAYFGSAGEPVMVDMSSIAIQGTCVGVVAFMVAAFQKTATIQHEAQIAATVLEDATFEALLIFDGSGLAMVNHQFVELTGCSLDQVRVPGTLESLVKGVDFASEVASAVIGNTKVIHGVQVEQGPGEDGTAVMVPVDVLIRRLDMRDSRVAVSLRDVSARIEMEAALRAADVAEASARGKAAFLSTISHELRNPLNAVLGMTQIVSSMRLSDDVRASVGNIVSATRAVLGILHQLLDYGRGVEGAIGAAAAEAFNLRDLVMDTLTLAMLQVDDSRVQVFGAFDPCTDHRVEADTGRIRQVLLNLLSNAIKFTREGHIRVRVTLCDKDELTSSSASSEPGEVLDSDEVMVSVAVEDTGPGIGAGDVEHVFGRYGRGGIDARADYGGYGLGLAICRDLVGLMKMGKIGVRSKKGEGSTFWFTFAARRIDDDGLDALDKTHLNGFEGSSSVVYLGRQLLSSAHSDSSSGDEYSGSGLHQSGTGVGVAGSEHPSAFSNDSMEASVARVDVVSSSMSYVRDNHASLVASLVVHVVTPQREISRWVADVAATWGFTVIVSRSLESACRRLGDSGSSEVDSPGPISILIVDAALKQSLKEDCSTGKMRRLLPPLTPIALLHSIHDAAFAQSFADFVDGNLSMPLCEEKLIATLVLVVPVLANTVRSRKVAGLSTMVTTAEDSLDLSATKISLISSKRRLGTIEEGSMEASTRFGRMSWTSSVSNLNQSLEFPASLDLRTLVIEDDPLNLAVIKKFLEMSGVTRIDTASDGADGAEALFANTYDFVLTDVHMPVMSGLDMVRAVAARAANDRELQTRINRTYIVILSGSVIDDPLMTELRAAGVKGTLQKPVMRSDLVAVLEEAARTIAFLSMSQSASSFGRSASSFGGASSGGGSMQSAATTVSEGTVDDGTSGEAGSDRADV